MRLSLDDPESPCGANGVARTPSPISLPHPKPLEAGDKLAADVQKPLPKVLVHWTVGVPK
jgi:hypothetical protein